MCERRTLVAEDAPDLAGALASADGLLLKPWLGADRFADLRIDGRRRLKRHPGPLGGGLPSRML